MPSADVVVVGAGLAGLTAAIALADAGARVEVVARGHAATHWTAGGLDVAAPRGQRDRRPRASPRSLRRRGPPVRVPRPRRSRRRSTGCAAILAAEGLTYDGDLDEPLRPVPTSIGGTRPAAILPAAQAAALATVVAGRAARHLRLRRVQGLLAGRDRGEPRRARRSGARPATREGRGRRASRRSSVELPGLAGRRNLTALDLARLFDDPAWRADGVRRDRRPRCGRTRRRGPGRVGLPAVLGLDRPRRGVRRRGRGRSRSPRSRCRSSRRAFPGCGCSRRFGRRCGGAAAGSSVGEPVVRVDDRPAAGHRGRRSAAAARDGRSGRAAVVLATGGIAGGGLIGDGRRNAGRAAPRAARRGAAGGRLAGATIRSIRAGHPLEAAGHPDRRPAPPGRRRGEVVFKNVAVVGQPARRPALPDRALRRRRRDRERPARGGDVRGRADRAAPRSRAPSAERRGAPDDDPGPRARGDRSVEVALSADECLKCNVCNTVCPVARVTDLFPGPKYVGPQAQRFRIATLLPPQGPATRVLASPDATVDWCSGCGMCTTACPADVKIAEMNSRARAELKAGQRPRFRDWLLGQTDLVGRLGRRVRADRQLVAAEPARSGR